MNSNNIINTNNEVFYIYIAVSILGLMANDLEYKNKKNKTIKFIRISTAIALLIVYIYFISESYKKYKKTNNLKRLLLFISSILFFIGGLINLYVEVKYNDDDTEEGIEI